MRDSRTEARVQESEPTGTGITRRAALRSATLGGLALGVGGVVSGCGSSSGGSSPTATRASRVGTPKRGGVLRAGIAGGSAADTLDAHSPVSHPDEARVVQLYDPLIDWTPEYSLVNVLADEVTHNHDGSVWTIRLRQGLEFHNGKSVTADDVIFTFQRIINPKDPKPQATSLARLSPDGLRKLDDRTVRFTLKGPDSIFDQEVAGYSFGIVPVGYDPKHPIGCGPFKFKSFQPGQQSDFVRFENYWRTGQPYVDEILIIDFVQDTARVNALLAGQVQAIDQVPPAQVKVLMANSAVHVLNSKTGSWLPFTMRVDVAPFNDVRVRQAMRLIVDRPQMVEQALSGFGVIANDLPGPFDPLYDHSIPQRSQDIEQAKSLLRQAGRSDLTVQLTTSQAAAGLVEASEVLAQQAKAAGVQINVREVDPSVFFGTGYLKWPFAQDFYFTRNYLPQIEIDSLPTSPYNETHFDNPRFNQLADQARAAVDESKRRELVHEMQHIQWTSGGDIVWGFNNQVDAYSTKLTGFEPARSGVPLTGYRFREVSFT